MSKKELEAQNVKDFANILRHPAGARFLAGLIDFCGVFSDNPDDGARKVGLMIYRMALDVDGGEETYIRGRRELEDILNRKEEQLE